ncbi:hypothetical protein N7462_011079 [Penicillium macrosclerotiorum]|uniref:uncharacterized protein n=1 Tax=Penicillium macrosclerotiorum TaxID=303699 RepID=UPI0025470AA4|nr:uncharacterized protein N7462_011079 [Penicillium macrosclerotiorum]KAJ5666670.1 hypothetical protein N7462_011079 [Penicillium macrosclerotiorum]
MWKPSTREAADVSLFGAPRRYRSWKTRSGSANWGLPRLFSPFIPIQSSPRPILENITVRKSALEPESDQMTNPRGTITLLQAVTAATLGAAYSQFAEGWVGRIATDHWADYVALEKEWTPETLLNATIYQTWARGRKVFEGPGIG